MSNYLITKNGRSALVLAMHHFFGKEQAYLLSPSFICNSTMDMVASANHNIVYFDINPDLSISIETLMASLKNTKHKNKAVLIPHYFGITQQNLHEIKALCEGEGAKLIEDHCHSFLNIHKNDLVGDASISTMRKSLDANFGLLITKEESKFADVSGLSDIKSLIKESNLNKRIKRYCFKLGLNPYSLVFDYIIDRIGSISSSKRHLNLDQIPRLKLKNSIEDLFKPYFDLNEIERQKTKEYKFLYDNLAENFHIYPINTDNVPQCLAISASSEKIVRGLRNSSLNVYRWPGFELPDEVKRGQKNFPVACDLSRNLLCLSLHQENGKSDLIRIIEILLESKNRII